jgi:hypothetical protein
VRALGIVGALRQLTPRVDLVEDVLVVFDDVRHGVRTDREVTGGESFEPSSTRTRPSLAGSPAWAWFMVAIACRNASLRYASPTQFLREYRYQYGEPPYRDARQLRGTS